MSNSYGIWVGQNAGLDVPVEIIQQEGRLQAIKMTGNDFSPAGSPCWELDLHTLQARGYVSEKGGRNMRTVPASVTVMDRDRIKVYWHHPSLASGQNAVVFRRDSL